MSLALTPAAPRLALVLATTICATGFAQRPEDFADLLKLAQAPVPAGAAPIKKSVPAAAPAQPAPDPAPAKAAPDAAPAKPAPDASPVAPTPAAPPVAPAGPGEQAAPPPPAPAPAAEPNLLGGPNAKASPSAIVNLLNLMVKKGLLTKEEAEQMVAQSESDAAVARTEAHVAGFEGAQELVQRAVEAKVLPDTASLPPDAIRVTHIPDIVKKQIRDEIKADLIAQSKTEAWVGNTKLPDWVSKFRIKGDIRLRYEGNYFPSGNDNTGAFPNFNSINTGSPFDVSSTVFSPQLNVDEDRQRFRIRARLGAEIDLADGFTAGLRLATGETNSPTSPNQSLGAANQGQGGNFSKYAIWLDRAYLKYESSGDQDKQLSISGGRFDNPFFSTDLIFDDDLGFDGIAVAGRYRLGSKAKIFGVAGAFPIFNTDFNFSSNQPAKFDSTDKYLYGGQLGLDLKLTKNLNLKVAGAYYVFDGADGKQSTPYTPLSASDAGDTDNTRPSFAQKGNTYMALRRIIPNANNNFGTSNQFQYFGLATKFQPMAITAKLDYNGFEPFQVSFTGEYIKNLGYDSDRLNMLGINNRGASSPTGTPGSYDGGDTAWILGIRGGSAALQKRGDWQLGMNYRHIESDAVIDGFNDSDFGLGGTNTKGFSIWASYAVSANTAFGIRWMSASQIAGPPLKSDLLQIDFSGKF
jgi:hypothetical protein